MLTHCLRKSFLINAWFPFMFQKLKQTKNRMSNAFGGGTVIYMCCTFTGQAVSNPSMFSLIRQDLAFITENGMN